VFFKKSNGAMCLADVIFTKSDPDLALLKTECEGKPIPFASIAIPKMSFAIDIPTLSYFLYQAKE
jgi:hypothetical protein